MGLSKKEEEALNIMISVLDSRIRWLWEHTPYATNEIRDICSILLMLIDMDFMKLKHRHKITTTKEERDLFSTKIARKELYKEEREIQENRYIDSGNTYIDNFRIMSDEDISWLFSELLEELTGVQIPYHIVFRKLTDFNNAKNKN